MSILGDSQTYIGVLATFVVLCLFSLRRSGNRMEGPKPSDSPTSGERDDDNNFIYALIRQVGADSLCITKREIEKLKGLYGDCYDKKGIDGKTRLQSAIDRAKNDHPNSNFEQLLMKAQTRYKSSISKFSNGANEKMTEFEKTQRMGLKDELTYVSLMSLIFIVVVMMVDSLSFLPVSWRALWMNLLIACSTPFLFYLYFRFSRKPFSILPAREKRQKKWGRVKILFYAIFPICIWLLLSSFINVPAFSLFLLPLVMGTFYFFSDRLVAQMEGGPEFNRSFILKMSAYFLIMAVALCAPFILAQKWSFFYEWGLSKGLTKFFDNSNNAVRLLFSMKLAKHAVVTYFSLNVFILPLLLGYFYIQRMTKDLASDIREMFKSSEGEIIEANDAFNKIILDMDSRPDGDEFGGKQEPEMN